MTVDYPEAILSANGIENFFARVGNFGRVNTNELCVDDICVTRDRFAVVFGNQSAAAGAPGPVFSAEAPDGSATPTAETSADIVTTPPSAVSSTTPDTEAITSASSTSEAVEPENDNEPAVTADSADEPQADESSHDGNSPVEPLPATGTQ